MQACMHRPGWAAGSIPPEVGDVVGKGFSLREETFSSVVCAGPRHHRGEQRLNLAFKR